MTRSWPFAVACAALVAACLVPDVELVHDLSGASGSAGASASSSDAGTLGNGAQGNDASGGDATSPTGTAGKNATGGSPSQAGTSGGDPSGAGDNGGLGGAVSGSGGGSSAAGSGGASTAGSGGSSAAGSGPVISGGGRPSTGCGAATSPTSGRYTITSGGVQRAYELDLPSSYQSTETHRLFFSWHWNGGTAKNLVNGLAPYSPTPHYGLKALADGQALFVAPEDDGTGTWSNTGDRQIQFVRDMLTRLKADLCIDQDRVFSTGFSSGAGMSISIGCSLPGIFRAIASMSGGQTSGCSNGTMAVSFWGSHGTSDATIPITQGRSIRDVFLDRNDCTTSTSQVGHGVQYQNCLTGFKLVWSEFAGDHAVPSWAPAEMFTFYDQF